MDNGFFLVIILIVVGSIAFSFYQSKQLEQSWSAVARKLGLIYYPGSVARDRMMSGTIDGCQVQVQTFTRGSGKRSKKYTRYRISYPQSLRVQFRITRQGFMSGLTKALGAQDIEVGDREFDQLVMIKGNDPTAVAAVLTPERRRKIMRVFSVLSDVEIDQVCVKLESYGRESSEPALIQKIQLLVEFARFMVREEGLAPEDESSISSSSKPMLMRKTVATSQPKPPIAPPPLPPVAAKNLLEPVGAPEVQVDVPTVTPTMDSVAEIGQTLFEKQSGITEIERMFASQFRGQKVSGTGVLRSSSENTYDFVFGTGKFVKATIEVPLQKSTSNLHRSFEVIVKLPISARTNELSKEFSFQGDLVKVDALMRKLYVDSFDDNSSA